MKFKENYSIFVINRSVAIYLLKLVLVYKFDLKSRCPGAVDVLGSEMVYVFKNDRQNVVGLFVCRRTIQTQYVVTGTSQRSKFSFYKTKQTNNLLIISNQIKFQEV